MSTVPVIKSSKATLRPESRDVHVKHVPNDVWCRARQNALASNLSFREFVIRLLATSSPVVEQPSQGALLNPAGE